jgi:hypothetical protein
VQIFLVSFKAADVEIGIENLIADPVEGVEPAEPLKGIVGEYFSWIFICLNREAPVADKSFLS